MEYSNHPYLRAMIDHFPVHYWKMRSIVVNPKNKTPRLIKYFLLFLIKKADSYNHCSFGTNLNWGATIVAPPELPHGPAGIMLGYNVIIEEGVTLYRNIMVSCVENGTVIHIKKNALLGTGCIILKPVTIGENAKIGANAVVLTDVPDNATFVGVPAHRVDHHS